MQLVFKISDGLLLSLLQLPSDIWAFKKFEKKIEKRNKKSELIFDSLVLIFYVNKRGIP